MVEISLSLGGGGGWWWWVVRARRESNPRPRGLRTPAFRALRGVNSATAALTARESASVLCASYTLVKLVP